MLKRSFYSLRHHWKKVSMHIVTYTVLFSLCFGAIMVYSTVRGQQEFLQGALQRSITLRAADYRIRIAKVGGEGAIFNVVTDDVIQTVLQDEAVEDWNVCRQFAMHLEGCELLYAEERVKSYEEHRYGQIFYVHEDGMVAVCVRDSARSQVFLTTGFQLIEGKHFSGDNPGDVLMVSEDFAKLNGLHAGDTVKVSNIQDDTRYEPFSAELEIIGIFRAPDSDLLKGIGARPEEMMVMPLALRDRLAQESEENYRQWFATFYLKEGTDRQALLERLQEKLPIRGVVEDSFGTDIRKPPEDTMGMNWDEIEEYVESHPQYFVQINDQLYNMVAKPVDQQVKLARFMLFLLLGSVVLIIALIVVLSVKERRREVGILLAMGESKIKVIGQLAIETTLPILVSMLIGIGFGTAAGVPLADNLCNGVYEQTATDSQSENNSVTFSAVLNDYSTPWDLSERQLIWALTNAQNYDMEVFPKAQVQSDPQATSAYAGILFAAALLALLAQSLAILTARPAKILLNRR